MQGRGARASAGSARPRAAGAALLFLLLAAGLLLPALAGATTLQHMTVEQLARRAVLVVDGTVLSTTVDQYGGDVRTTVELRVRTALKGAPGAVATFAVPGGALPDGTLVRVDAMPRFTVGEECYVFVDARGWVIAGYQGKIGVSGGKTAGGHATRAEMDARIRAALGPGAPAESTDGALTPARTAGAHALAAPVITSVSPGGASAGTDTPVVITGTGFGTSRGWVEFTYGNDDVDRIEAPVNSWSATRIQCVVPTAIILDYSASAGSGPMWVTTADGRESAPFDFSVPFSYGGEYWASPRVTYYVNTSGIDATLRESLVDAGTATWNAAGSGFTFVDGGATTATIAQDGKNVISWAWGLPDGVIAQSSSWSRSGHIAEADIRYSNDFAWGDGAPGSNTMDVQSIAMHEVGHWLTLNDLYGPGDTDKVMYGFSHEEIVKRALTEGDIEGIKWIYPLDATAPQVGVKNATARRNQVVKLYFRVFDDLSAEVASQLQVVNNAGAVKKSWAWDYGENYDGWWSVKYRAALPKGKYTLIVTGTDLVGNSAKAFGTLTVK